MCTDGLQLRIRLPYTFEDRTTYDYVSPAYPSRTIAKDGWGDLELGGRCRLLGGEGKPLTLVTGLNVKLDSADKNKGGSGTTNISPYLAIDTTMHNGALRPYASYQAIVRNHGASDSHLLTIGAEYMISKDVSLVPSLGATFRTSSATLSSHESYGFSLAGFLQLFHNFYLIPSTGAGISTPSHTKDGTVDYNTTKYVNAGLGLYYLFN